MKRQLILSLSAVSLGISCVSVALAERADGGLKQQSTMPAPLIRYQDGRLTVRVHELSLGEVLRMLGTVTGATLTLCDPSIARQTVSASLEAQPYAEGIRVILDGFSYAISPGEGKHLPTVTVLSTPRPSDTRHARAANTARATLGSTTQENGSEKLLNRALEALTEAKHIDHDVLEQLVGAQDPRATEVLVQAASGSSATESRVQAVEALWRHTADHAFGDENAVASLEQLAEDADPRVSTIAHQALQDMKQFRQNNAAQ